MELFDDHIDIAGRRRFGARWSRTVHLAGLNATPSRVWASERPYTHAAVFVFFAFFIVTVVGSLILDAANVHGTSMLVLAAVIVWIAAVLALLLISRSVEHVIFSTMGHVPVIIVTLRRKSQRADFDAFVEATSERIRQQGNT
ncbi:MAG TPA: hypothetical protein VLU46_12290 [Thermoanaerobaculia bacterium]|nr:hypothetical protein [Thermoanaerobaculia bacterium]